MTFILSTIFTVIVRQLLKRLVTKEYHRSGANEKIMLVTTSDQVERVIKKIKTTRNWDFRISNIAILDCDMVGEIVDKIEVVATADNLLQVISTAEIDSVFVHLPDNYPFKQREFVTVLNEMGKTVHLNVNEYEAKVGEHYMDFLGKYAVVTWKNKTYRVRHLLIKKADRSAVWCGRKHTYSACVACCIYRQNSHRRPWTGAHIACQSRQKRTKILLL